MTSDELALSGVEMQPVKWQDPPTGDLPYATHHGLIQIGDDHIRCYQLSDGRRIFDGDDVNRLLGLAIEPQPPEGTL